MKLFYAIAILAAVITSSSNAEKINLSVYASNLDSLSIAMVPFTQKGPTALKEDEPWKILANDLEFSGRFSVNKLSKIDSGELIRKNIPVYIDGSYSVGNGEVELEYSLRDASSSELFFGKKYSTTLKDLRSVSHRFADQLIEMLFNGHGIFESKILFVKDEGAKKNIWIMDWDGDRQHALTSNTTINIFPTFMDSSAFLFTSFLRGHPNIYKSTMTGKTTYLVPSRFTDTSPAYCAVLGKITFASSRDGNMEIYTCDQDGTNIKRLTNSKSIDAAPCFSPNGMQIAFTSDRAGQPQIYIMDADGTNVKKLTFGGTYQDSPAWSPKGDKIAFHMAVNGQFEIFTCSLDGSNVFQVTNCPGNNEYASWAGDGEHIVFCSERGTKHDLYGIKSDGTRLKRLTNIGMAKMPDWGN